MRKYLYIAVFLVATTPSIAFASWWNPFSWGIFSSLFHPKEQAQIVVENVSHEELPKATTTEATSTQNSTSSPLITDSDMTLCNGQYYKKCEVGQLLVCPTDAKVEAYCSIPKTPKVKDLVVSPKKDTQPSVIINSKNQTAQKAPETDPQAVNFSSLVSSAQLSQSKSYQDLVSLCDKSIEYVDTAVDELNTLIAKNEGIVAGLGYENSKLSQAFIEEYKGDLKTTMLYRDNLVSYKDTAAKNSTIWKNSAIANSNRFISREDGIAALVALQNDTNWQTSLDYIHTTFENYSKYRKGRDDYYVKIDAQLRALYEKMNMPTSAPSYQPQPAPQILLPTYTPPTTTNCTISGDGGVGFQSYVNCTSY